MAYPTNLETGKDAGENQPLVPTNHKGVLYAGRRCFQQLNSKNCCATITRFVLWILLATLAGFIMGVISDIEKNQQPGRTSTSIQSGFRDDSRYCKWWFCRACCRVSLGGVFTIRYH